jgi:hypothetical protein
MKLPIINHALALVFKGKTHHVTCTDLFDGGYGYYFDAFFPKTTRRKFSDGEQCTVPELGKQCLADFASYPKKDRRTVRFLIPKWSS